MKFLLISFKSRNSIYSLMNKLKNYGIQSSVVNTPSNISSSCSLSLKTLYEYKNSIINIIKQNPYNDIIGIFAIGNYGFRERIYRLY